MVTRHPRAVGAIALVFITGLFSFPACHKKKDTGANYLPPLDDGSKESQPEEPDDPSLPPPPHTSPHPGVADSPAMVASENNLKQIAVAFHNSEKIYGAFPLGIADGKGKVGLSWRVAVLPYLAQEKLYKQFKLDEPWNSEHNRRLIERIPQVYAPPGVRSNGYTYYRSFSGPGAILPPPRRPGRPGEPILGLRTDQIPDGLANTLMIAEGPVPVIWTKPDELPFTPGNPPKLGGGLFDGGFHAAFCDGNIKFIKSSIDAATLSNLIQTNDGNMVKLP